MVPTLATVRKMTRDETTEEGERSIHEGVSDVPNVRDDTPGRFDRLAVR